MSVGIAEKLRDANWLREQYWDEGLSASEIAELVGVSKQTILVRMRKLQVPRRSLSESQKGSLNNNWKGGRVYSSGGYVLSKKPDHPYSQIEGYVLEHRLVMEEMLGRVLEPRERVHHRNGIKDDNRAENLELVVVGPHRGEIECPHCHEIFRIR